MKWVCGVVVTDGGCGFQINHSQSNAFNPRPTWITSAEHCIMSTDTEGSLYRA